MRRLKTAENNGDVAVVWGNSRSVKPSILKSTIAYRGTDFFLSSGCATQSLPRDAVHAGVGPLEATISNAGRPFTPVRVLLVEDNPWDVDFFKDYVGDRASVRVAVSGAEAFDRIFRRGRFASEPLPQLIVLDLNIPLLTGHELLNAVKAHSTTCHIPVVIWSVSENPADVRKAYELGACAYLLKVSSVPDMEATLRAFAEFWLHAVRYEA